MKREFRQLRLSQLDRNLELARNLPPRPSGGWISSVREALGISQREVGKKMRASGQAIQQLEQAEAEDRISIRALRRVAGKHGMRTRLHTRSEIRLVRGTGGPTDSRARHT
jgi:hypothetical protein